MNTNPDNTYDDLLVSYLLGEANAIEQKMVEEWIEANDENKKYFEHFKSILEESRQLGAQRPVNENEAWERIVNRAKEDEQNEQRISTKSLSIPLFRQTWTRIAAILVLFAGIGALLYTMNGPGAQKMARSGDTPVTDTLPDGSIVVLNKNSSLSYPAKFDGENRSVTLTGEAFFNITPNKSKPFIIDANHISITVVGTSFNVKTSPERTEVIVETGIVEVAKKQRAVRLTPNQKATVVPGNDEPQTEANTDELYNYYRTGEFVCKATPLRKLVAVLNDAYDAHITIQNNKVGDIPITTAFKNEPLDNILKVISETLSVTVERKGDSIHLTQPPR